MESNIKFGKLIYEHQSKNNILMAKGFTTIILFFYIIFFFILIQNIALPFYLILFGLVALTIFTYIIEYPKIYSKGIMREGIKLKDLFCNYASIKNIKVLTKKDKKNTYNVIQIMCLNGKKPIVFDTRFDSDRIFLKHLKKILKEKYPKLKWEKLT